MKNTFRQSMKWLHTGVGLIVGWVLFFMFITGTVGYVYEEVNRWMQPERPLITPHIPKTKLIDTGQKYLEIHAADSKSWDIFLPSARDGNLQVGWRASAKEGERRGKYIKKVIDPQTGEAVNTRDTIGGRVLYRMHYRLHYMSTDISYWIVGVCSLILLIAVVTGVVIYKKIFVDFFTFRAKKGLTGWLDIHNVFSVAALPYHFMITYSGLIFFLFTYMAPSVDYQTNEEQYKQLRAQIFPKVQSVEPANLHAPLQPLSKMYVQAQQVWGEDSLDRIEVSLPQDKNSRVKFVRWETDITYNPYDYVSFDGSSSKLIEQPIKQYTVPAMIHNGLFSLHEGQFAGPLLRLFYVISGLLGAAMIASGLILWTSKRKPKEMKKEGGPSFGFKLVDQLNVGTIIGFPIALACLFISNRLLPLDIVNRGQWEVHIMFIVWAIMLIQPMFRPTSRAWFDQSLIAAIAFSCIPLVNLLTTDRHLGETLFIGDWNYAAFDLSMLIIGLCFTAAAVRLKPTDPLESAIYRREKITATLATKRMGRT
ncbi:PepSY domain-containing protein [Psychrobium sp. 1_MG-2023]|uniref:PepSY-associated TM helix domain-containing protein n=1 Tax=Psychrobium sp. 1_MG-2023 TaxID=3062624 RepID=UPI000C3328DD|nr:PepSY-associated TM helix domain-containing protein [Psychrobium sp. 1_MG-2023]MDP2561924.1 PepSY-associated TM helix domain-containing protein [Psychrobium sp. 1_MG-2023]PKF58693.1 hypothetical protein CW748_03395 [Alteromonadales bacterium alter-6D02]